MEWSKELPTEEGFYWWRKGQARDIVNIIRLRGGLMVDAGDEFEKLGFFTGSEWAGPIPEPTDPKEA